jgi:hypothetical protein
LAHKGLYLCPICHETFKVTEGFQHLQKHGITVLVGKRLAKVLAKTLNPAYEYGTPFWEVGRTLIPQDKWSSEKVYNGELRGWVSDENGNPTPIANPSLLAYDIIRELRNQGLDAQYIRIDQADILSQAKGSPVAWYIQLLIIAIAFAIFAYFGSQAFKLVADTLYRIFVAPIPPEWRPYVFGIIGAGIAVALIAYAYSKFKGKG